MGTHSAVGAVQAAVYQVLSAESRLTDLAKIYDEVPPDHEWPYVEIGELEEIPNSTFTNLGRDVTVTLHIYSQASGFKEGEAIIDVLDELLDEGDVSNPDGWTTIRNDLVVGVTNKDDNPEGGPIVRHFIRQYRIQVERS